MAFSEINIYQVKPDKTDEFDTDENYAKGQRQVYETYWKSIEKCLIVPHDKLLGEVIFS